MALHAADRLGRLRAGRHVPPGCCWACSTAWASTCSRSANESWTRPMADRPATSPRRSARPDGPAEPAGRGLVRLAGHADVRWHLWIVLAALGRLDVALVAYAAYFPARALAGAVRKGGPSCLSPRISALILATDEAANLPGCLASRCAGPTRSSSSSTAPAATRPRRSPERGADVVAVRTFDDFAGQRNAALDLATGDWVFAVDADERATPGTRRRDPPGDVRPGPPAHAGYRVPIRSVILGRPFALLGDAARPAAPPLPPRDAGRWVGAVHETVELAGTAGQLRHALQHRTIPDMQTFLRKINDYTTLEAIAFEREGRRLPRAPTWRSGRPGRSSSSTSASRASATASRGSSSAPCRASRWRSGTGSTASGSVPGEGRRDDLLLAARGRGRRAVRPAPATGSRPSVAADDVRLCAVRGLPRTVAGPPRPRPGMRQGRFAARLAAAGAEVVGLDRSAAMLAAAGGLDRVRGSARRLPFAPGDLRRRDRGRGLRAPCRHQQYVVHFVFCFFCVFLWGLARLVLLAGVHRTPQTSPHRTAASDPVALRRRWVRGREYRGGPISGVTAEDRGLAAPVLSGGSGDGSRGAGPGASSLSGEPCGWPGSGRARWRAGRPGR